MSCFLLIKIVYTVDFNGGLISVTEPPGQSFTPQNVRFETTVVFNSGFSTVELIILPHIEPL